MLWTSSVSSRRCRRPHQHCGRTTAAWRNWRRHHGIVRPASRAQGRHEHEENASSRRHQSSAAGTVVSACPMGSRVETYLGTARFATTLATLRKGEGCSLPSRDRTVPGRRRSANCLKTWLKAWESYKVVTTQMELVGTAQTGHQGSQGYPSFEPPGVLALARRRLPAPRGTGSPARAVERPSGHRRSVPVHRTGTRRGQGPRPGLGAEALSAPRLARPGVVFLPSRPRRRPTASPRRASRISTNRDRTSPIWTTRRRAI